MAASLGAIAQVDPGCWRYLLEIVLEKKTGADKYTFRLRT